MIKKTGSTYKVVSKTGKNLGGDYSTRSEAAKRLMQVEYFKNKGKANGSMGTKKTSRG